MNLVEADAAAVRKSTEMVANVTPDDWALPTPCTDWNLAELLAHMTGQHRGFSAAAQGRGDDVSVWEAPALEDKPLRRYTESADEVIASFQSKDILDRPFALPELGLTVPGRLAVGFHLLDYLVHGWDVARTIGIPYSVDPAVVNLALPIARIIPTGPERSNPGALFAPARPVSATADSFEEILALLGRNPE